MRKAASGLVCLAVLAMAAGRVEAGIGVRAIAGFSHISYSDFNDWVDVYNNDAGGVLEMDKIQWVPELGAEVYYPFFPMVEVALGTGMPNHRSSGG